MTERAHFSPDKGAYIRSHVGMAVVFSLLGMGALALMGNPHLWTAAVGAFAAIGFRGWFLWSEVREEDWILSATQLDGPQGRVARLGDVTKLNRIFSSVQIVTASGDKHLIRYQADREATIARIEAEMGRR